MKHLGDQACVAEIRERIAALTPDDTGGWGSMTVFEMVCHLRESFAGATARPQWKLRIQTPLPPRLLKFFALWTPVKWPRNVETVHELKRGTVVPPSTWVADRNGLDEALTSFLASQENRWPHPMFGSMGPKDWLRWGLLHSDHHLRQFGR